MRARPLLPCLLAVLAWAPPAHAAVAKFAVGPEPAWIDRVERGDDTSLPDESARYGLYDLLFDQQVRVTEGGKWRYLHRAQKLVSPSGVESVSELELSFEPSYEHLTIHYVRIVRAGKSRSALHPDEVQVIQQESDRHKRMFNGTLTAVLILKDVRVGDVLEYAYTIDGQNPLFAGPQVNNLTLGLAWPVRRLRHRVLWPAAIPLHVRQHGTTLQPVVREVPGGREYVWQIDGPKVVTTEDQLPVWYDPWPWIQLSRFGTWGEVARWAAPMYAPAPLGPGLKAQVAAWRDQIASPEARLLAATRFVQADIRYLGIEVGASSHRPHPPAEVFQKRYGDCKDKTLLLLSVLSALGIPAEAALVDTESRRDLDTWQPTPLAFNHVILRVVLGGKTYWIDSTDTYQRGGIEHLVPPPFERALVVREDTTGLSKIEAGGLAAPTLEVRESFAIKDYEQPVAMQVVTMFSGERAASMRADLAERPRAELAKDYLNHYAQGGAQIKPAGELEVADDPARDVITITERYVISDFWKGGAHEFGADTITAQLARPRITLRSMPLSIPHPVDVLHTTAVTLPDDDWKIAPLSSRIEQAGVHFERETSAAGRLVKMTYRYRSTADSVSVAELPSYLQALDRIGDETSYTLTLGTGEKGGVGQGHVLLAMGGVFGIVLLSAGLSQLRRRLRRARVASRYVHGEGETATTAFRVSGVEAALGRIRRLRCTCGGQMERRDEGPDAQVMLGERPITVIALRCASCGAQRRSYFDLG